MSTSLLYHGFGIRGYRYERTEYLDGCVVFAIAPQRVASQCPRCGSCSIQRRGYKRRYWHTLPIGHRQVFIGMDIPRVFCQACGVTSQIPVSFAVPNRSYTRAFERYALGLRQHMTVQAVADHLGVSWWEIKDIEKRYLYRKFSKPKLTRLRQIAID